MMLEAKTNELMDMLNDFMKDCLGEFLTVESVLDMDEDEFKKSKKYMEIMTACKEYAVIQARTLDEINEKLDLLLDK